MNKEKYTGLGLGILVGIILGGVVALLYAPKSGKETRTIIKEKVVTVGKKAKALSSKIAAKAKLIRDRKGRFAGKVASK